MKLNNPSKKFPLVIKKNKLLRSNSSLNFCSRCKRKSISRLYGTQQAVAFQADIIKIFSSLCFNEWYSYFYFTWKLRLLHFRPDAYTNRWVLVRFLYILRQRPFELLSTYLNISFRYWKKELWRYIAGFKFFSWGNQAGIGWLRRLFPYAPCVLQIRRFRFLHLFLQQQKNSQHERLEWFGPLCPKSTEPASLRPQDCLQEWFVGQVS